MTKMNPYLTFNGNCKDAMTFYQQCLGGELLLQFVGESPMADKMPAQMQKCVLHATLTTQGFVIMGSDMAPDTGIIKGNTVSIMLNCSSEEEINSSFNKLSAEGGEIKHHLEHTFWGALFGDLTDKFGNNWILNYLKN